MEFKYRYLIFLVMICMVIVYVQGESSAAFYSASYSTNGKIVKVNQKNVNPVFDSIIHVSNYYNPINNLYINFEERKDWGTDSKGRKYTKSYDFNYPYDYSILNIASGSFSWKSKIIKVNNDKSTEKISGKLNSKTSFTGNSVYTFGGLMNRVTKLTFKQSGKRVATSTITSIKTYDKSGTWMKMTNTMHTSFTNGDWRNSKLTTIYYYKDYVGCIGMKTSGTSSGREKVGTKKARYTGVISITTRHHTTKTYSGYSFGNYKETKKSSSKKLQKKIPYEACSIRRHDTK